MSVAYLNSGRSCLSRSLDGSGQGSRSRTYQASVGMSPSCTLGLNSACESKIFKYNLVFKYNFVFLYTIGSQLLLEKMYLRIYGHHWKKYIFLTGQVERMPIKPRRKGRKSMKWQSCSPVPSPHFMFGHAATFLHTYRCASYPTPVLKASRLSQGLRP